MDRDSTRRCATRPPQVEVDGVSCPRSDWRYSAGQMQPFRYSTTSTTTPAAAQTNAFEEGRNHVLRKNPVADPEEKAKTPASHAVWESENESVLPAEWTSQVEGAKEESGKERDRGHKQEGSYLRRVFSAALPKVEKGPVDWDQFDNLDEFVPGPGAPAIRHMLQRRRWHGGKGKIGSGEDATDEIFKDGLDAGMLAVYGAKRAQPPVQDSANRFSRFRTRFERLGEDLSNNDGIPTSLAPTSMVEQRALAGLHDAERFLPAHFSADDEDEEHDSEPEEEEEHDSAVNPDAPDGFEHEHPVPVARKTSSTSMLEGPAIVFHPPKESNFAYHGAVRASKYFYKNRALGKCATDGKKSTKRGGRFDKKFCTRVKTVKEKFKKPDTHWLRIDLGQEVEIGRVEIASIRGYNERTSDQSGDRGPGWTVRIGKTGRKEDPIFAENVSAADENGDFVVVESGESEDPLLAGWRSSSSRTASSASSSLLEERANGAAGLGGRGGRRGGRREHRHDALRGGDEEDSDDEDGSGLSMFEPALEPGEVDAVDAEESDSTGPHSTEDSSSLVRDEDDPTTEATHPLDLAETLARRTDAQMFERSLSNEKNYQTAWSLDDSSVDNSEQTLARRSDAQMFSKTLSSVEKVQKDLPKKKLLPRKMRGQFLSIYSDRGMIICEVRAFAKTWQERKEEVVPVVNQVSDLVEVKSCRDPALNTGPFADVKCQTSIAADPTTATNAEVLKNLCRWCCGFSCVKGTGTASRTAKCRSADDLEAQLVDNSTTRVPQSELDKYKQKLSTPKLKQRRLNVERGAAVWPVNWKENSCVEPKWVLMRPKKCRCKFGLQPAVIEECVEARNFLAYYNELTKSRFIPNLLSRSAAETLAEMKTASAEDLTGVQEFCSVHLIGKQAGAQLAVYNTDKGKNQGNYKCREGEYRTICRNPDFPSYKNTFAKFDAIYRQRKRQGKCGHMFFHLKGEVMGLGDLSIPKLGLAAGDMLKGVKNCAACGKICYELGWQCGSFECSPTQKKCQFNTRAEPDEGSENRGDIIFCAQEAFQGELGSKRRAFLKKRFLRRKKLGLKPGQILTTTTTTTTTLVPWKLNDFTRQRSEFFNADERFQSFSYGDNFLNNQVLLDFSTLPLDFACVTRGSRFKIKVPRGGHLWLDRVFAIADDDMFRREITRDCGPRKLFHSRGVRGFRWVFDGKCRGRAAGVSPKGGMDLKGSQFEKGARLRETCKKWSLGDIVLSSPDSYVILGR